MHLIINDQSPFSFAEQTHMSEVVFLFPTMCKDLIRCYRDGPYVLRCSVIFANLVFRQPSFAQNFALPLLNRGDIRRKDQRRAVASRHCGDANHGFACPARQHENAASAFSDTMKGINGTF